MIVVVVSDAGEVVALSHRRDLAELAEALQLLERRRHVDGLAVRPAIAAAKRSVCDSARLGATRVDGSGDDVDDAPMTLPRLLDFTEVADRLGVTPRQVERYVESGALVAVSIGQRGRRIDSRDLLEFMDRLRANAAKTRQEVGSS